VRQQLPGESSVEISYLFAGIPTEVWEEPHVEGEDREETDRESRGLGTCPASISPIHSPPVSL